MPRLLPGGDTMPRSSYGHGGAVVIFINASINIGIDSILLNSPINLWGIFSMWVEK